jgi:hypothetical protein
MAGFRSSIAGDYQEVTMAAAKKPAKSAKKPAKSAASKPAKKGGKK